MLPLRNSERVMIAIDHQETTVVGSKRTRLVAVKETENHYLPEPVAVDAVTKAMGGMFVGWLVGYAISALVFGVLCLIF